MKQHCNICSGPLNTTNGYSIGRGNFLPAIRLCDRCGNPLEPVMQKLETLATVHGGSASTA